MFLVVYSGICIVLVMENESSGFELVKLNYIYENNLYKPHFSLEYFKIGFGIVSIAYLIFNFNLNTVTYWIFIICPALLEIQKQNCKTPSIWECLVSQSDKPKRDHMIRDVIIAPMEMHAEKTSELGYPHLTGKEIKVFIERVVLCCNVFSSNCKSISLINHLFIFKLLKYV